MLRETAERDGGYDIMAKHCQIDKIGIDVPCFRRHTIHHLSFVSRTLGDKRKIKIPICEYHYNLLDEKNIIANLLDENPKHIQNSDHWEASLS